MLNIYNTTSLKIFFFSNSATEDIERPNASRNKELNDRRFISTIFIQGPNLSFSATLC
jgi:hypothetical protein